jgi:hypothetical protein
MEFLFFIAYSQVIPGNPSLDDVFPVRSIGSGMGYFGTILDRNFLPHGHCFFWTTDVFWLHLIGDIITAAAYYIIPFVLIYFVRKRKHLP